MVWSGFESRSDLGCVQDFCAVRRRSLQDDGMVRDPILGSERHASACAQKKAGSEFGGVFLNADWRRDLGTRTAQRRVPATWEFGTVASGGHSGVWLRRAAIGRARSLRGRMCCGRPGESVFPSLPVRRTLARACHRDDLMQLMETGCLRRAAKPQKNTQRIL